MADSKGLLVQMVAVISIDAPLVEKREAIRTLRAMIETIEADVESAVFMLEFRSDVFGVRVFKTLADIRPYFKNPDDQWLTPDEVNQ